MAGHLPVAECQLVERNAREEGTASQEPGETETLISNPNETPCWGQKENSGLDRRTQVKNREEESTTISKTFQKKKGESKMSKFGKYFLLVTGFALLATFARIPGANINVHAHKWCL